MNPNSSWTMTQLMASICGVHYRVKRLMKILRKTSDQLVLSYTSWLRGLLLVGILLLILARTLADLGSGSIGPFGFVQALVLPVSVFSILFYLFVRRVQLVLDRTSDTFTVRERTLFGYRSQKYRLSDFRCGEMQEMRGRKHRKLFRPVLHFVHSDGVTSFPLFVSYSKWSGQMHDAIDTLNDWALANQVDSQP